MTTREDMEVLYDMVTVDAAAAMGIEGHTLEVGSPANLVVLQQPDLIGAFRFHQPPLAVISGGRLLEELND
jgi:cytosine deaminase